VELVVLRPLPFSLTLVVDTNLGARQQLPHCSTS